MRNIFLEESYKKCGGEAIPRPFSKLNCGPLAFTSYKAFFKNKKGSGTSLPASLSA